jgi:hypothetical protein
MKQTKKEQIALLFSFLSITDVGHERFINVFLCCLSFRLIIKSIKKYFQYESRFGG